MKKFIKTTMLTAIGVALASQVAQAANPNNDLILGFTQAGGANDYIIDIGQATTSVGVGTTPTAPVDLSSFLNTSTFASTFSGPGVVSAGIVGGKGGAVNQVYLTTTRSGVGTPAVPGSTGRTDFNTTQTSTAANQANGTAPGVVSSSSPSSFTVNILGNYSSAMSYNPSTPIGSANTYEDLWLYKSSSLATPTYEGYFTINESTDTLNFTPAGLAAVPEPSTYGLLAGAGLLVLSLRRQFMGKLA